MGRFSKGRKPGKRQERRLIGDRRWCQERRIGDLPVADERRSGKDRRTAGDRRERD